MNARILAVLLPLALCACQAGYAAHARDVQALVSAERFGDAAQAEVQFAYPPGDRILELLNEGALLHDAGHYRESNARLLEAEDRLADFYRRSAAGELARSAVSGTSGDYLAEDFERILVYVYTAQNYLALGQPKEAVVEARRLTERLGVLGDVRGHGRHYQADGFAQWLAALLFEDGGQPSDARIAFEAALSAFAPGALPEPLHAQLCADAQRAARAAGVPSDAKGCPANADASPLGSEGELVLLHAGGLVGARAEQRTSCGFLASGPLWCSDDTRGQAAAPKLVTVAVPLLQRIPAQIAAARLLVDGAATPLGRVEDVSAIAELTLRDRVDEDRRQATTRALARLAASTGAGVGAGKLAQKSGRGEAIGLLAGTLTHAALSETEEADLRSWFTLPAYFGLARVRLPAGRHAVKVELQDAAGKPVRTVDLGTVEVTAGGRTWLSVRSGR